MAFTLRPTALDDAGLRAALKNYAEEWSRWSNIRLDIQDVGFIKDRLPAEVETTIYRVAQEALTNVTRHATGATRVNVLLQRGKRHILTIIEDDGAGFNSDAPVTKQKLGIAGMRERAALVEGTLTIESTPGVGTTVFLHIPLKAD